MPVTITAALAFVLDRERTVFVERVRGAVKEVFAIPTTEAEELVPVAFAAVDRFRTVFPVIVFEPDVATMPPITRLEPATEGT
jgi:hypothetical protein